MTYTNAVLFLLGLLGILLHNLIQLNGLNKKAGGKLSVRSYLKLERFAIMISVLVVIAAIIIKHEIASLEAAGNWLGFSFITIGYFGQSLVIKLMGKAEKIVDK